MKLTYVYVISITHIMKFPSVNTQCFRGKETNPEILSEISLILTFDSLSTVSATTQLDTGRLYPKTADASANPTAPTLLNDTAGGSSGGNIAPEPPYFDIPRDNDVTTNDADLSTPSGA